MSQTTAPQSLRAYQARIVQNVGNHNAILKLPTGSGKTIIAAEMIRLSLQTSPLLKIVFLVPTCELVEQQSQVVESWVNGVTVSRFSGGMADPELSKFHVLVATPQAFLNLKTRQQYPWNAFQMVIYDEVHHVLKEHPYRSIALLLKDHRRDAANAIQVIGLSASLTYQIADVAIQKTLERLCYELDIQKMESPTSEELKQGGYIAQRRGDGNIELDVSTEVPDGVIPRHARKPHLMLFMFQQRIKNGETTQLASFVWQVIVALESKCESTFPTFVSPLTGSNTSAWEEYAHAIATSLTNSNGDHANLFSKLEVWYVALRVLVTTWEEDEQIVLQWLGLSNALDIQFDTEEVFAEEPLRQIRIRMDNPYNQYKWNRLKHHILDKRQRFGESFRCIIFVQQRIASHVLASVINKQLQANGIQAGYVSSRNAKITPSIRMNKTLVKNTLQNFRTGSINVLVATSVVEEGIDVPEANVILLYDSMKDSVELCQRYGRARAHESSIVILDERHDRPVTLLEDVRQMQDIIIEDFNPNNIGINISEERNRQKHREQVAYNSVLCNEKCSASPVLALNEYKVKTKASLSEEWSSVSGGFQCSLEYKSIIRTLQSSAIGDRKQEAKTLACRELLQQLQRETRCL